MKKLMDLHVHSSYSDGDHTPEELISIAKANNVGIISITDHDTVLAYHHLKPQNNIDIIPGIELTAADDVGRMHILGYGIDPFNQELMSVTEELKENSIELLLSIVEYLKKKGIRFNPKDISCLLNKDGYVSKNELAKLCVDYGYSETVREAFKLYLIEAYLETKTKKTGYTYQECFEIIKHAGGIPVLAHPVTLKRSDSELDLLINDMIKYGLEGMEVYHSSHSANLINKYLLLAQKYGLLYSAGTDYHGETTKPAIVMGTGKQKTLSLTGCIVLEHIKNRK